MSIHLGYLIHEGWLGMKRAKGAVALSISTIAIALGLLGVFILLTVNIQQIVQRFQQQLSVEVFIDNGLDTQGIELLNTALKRCPGVSAVAYISKEQALKNFEQEFGEDLISLLGENPLPASFRVHLELDRPTGKQLDQIVTHLKQIPGVDEVVFQGRLFEMIGRYSRIIIIVDILLMVVVLISTILVVANTLRLIILSQQETIEIMQLVGATSRFIRLPYLIQGVLQGFYGGVVSALFMIICVQIIRYQFPQLLKVTWPIVVLPVFLGTILGMIGSSVGLRRFFRA